MPRLPSTMIVMAYLELPLRFYLGSSLAFCSGSSVRSSLMNEMSFLGSVSRRRRISMSVSQPIPVGHWLRLR